MKHKRGTKLLSILLSLVLMLGLLPAVSLADGGLWEGPVSVEMVSHFGSGGESDLFGDATYTDTAYYSDRWFLADSATLNYDLALMSAMACGASYSRPSDLHGQKISALLEAMRFSDVERNEYYIKGTNETDSIGCIIGRKTIADESGEYTLLAVFPRNAGYGNEWSGNFNLGAEGDHAGFVLARDQVLDFMGQYLYGITGRVKVWCAGYSRGAATANLVGGYLAEHENAFTGVTIAPEDIFVYTIGTPLTVNGPSSRLSAYPYSGIHNFVAVGDYITKLPPADWGFTRYGVTETVDYCIPEALAWLRLISRETADSFAHGGYSAARPMKTLDFAALNVVETDYSISPDALLDECLAALRSLADRQGFTGQNYYRILGDVTVLFETVGGTFGKNISSQLKTGELKTGELINAAIANYLVYAAAQQRKETPGLTDEEAVTQVMIQLLAYVGINTNANESMKELMKNSLAFLIDDLKNNQLHHDTIVGLVPETARPMLSNLWDYIVTADVHPETVSDVIAMVTNSGVVNQANLAVIGNLIPADSKYKALYNDLAAYVVEYDVKPRSVDDVASLLTHFIVANADANPDGPAWNLLNELVPKIPTEPIDMQQFIRSFAPWLLDKDYLPETALEVIVLDFIRACNDGAYSRIRARRIPAEEFRPYLLSLVCSGLGADDIGNFILHPDDPTYDVTVGELAGNILKLALPKVALDKEDKVTKTLTLTEAADKALADLLDVGAGNNTYANDLKSGDNLSKLRTLATALFFRPDGYDLATDVRNAATFVDQIMFLAPAHDHELYISWLKTHVTCRAVFESSGGSAVEDVVGLALGAYVPKPANPVRAGYAFGGWFQDPALTQPWRFESDTVRSVCTVLYARWDAYDYGPVPSATTVTVSGEDATVNVKVEVKGNTATVKEADIDKVLSAEEVGTVTVDLSGLEANIDEATVPGAMVKKIADAVADEKCDADGLEIRLPTGSVTLDADALAAVNGQAGGKDLTLHLDGIKVTELSSAQQDAVKDLEIEVVLDAYLTANGKRITDFNGGNATVKVPYTLKEGQTAQGLVVWYVAADGTRTQVPASYDGKNVVFTVPHFSNYVIAYDAEKAKECPKDSTCPMAAFTDLDPTAWYHDGIHFCLENGMMKGLGDGVFDPNGTTSRAMIVTILYRLEGEPMIRSGMPFSDVTESDWYAMAVSWAESRGILNGFEDGSFRPNDPITREQLAAVLYRYAQTKGEGFTGLWSFKLDFPDAGEVSDWATEAMSWMVMNGVINGMDGRLNPQGNATRAQAAAMVQRFCELIK